MIVFFFLIFYIYFYFMYRRFLPHLRMWIMCAPEAGGRPEALLNSLRLELQTAAHCPVGAGNETQVFCEHS